METLQEGERGRKEQEQPSLSSRLCLKALLLKRKRKSLLELLNDGVFFNPLVTSELPQWVHFSKEEEVQEGPPDRF